MPLVRLTWPDVQARMARFSAVIDARSESEFAEDHLPGAVNWPTLNDAERHRIGTLYKQVSAFEARKQGAVCAAANIARHLEREGPGLQRDWKPLVYCWRGGQRSGSLALVLSQIGFEVTVLEQGYRGFRRHVLDALTTSAQPFSLEVLCGTTGSGKSRLLEALQAAGAQVLDLEALASHRGSVLGELPQAQPSQKAFETAVWQALQHLDASQPVWVEAESRTIGRLRVPEALTERMRASRCWRVEVPLADRVRFLLREYAHHCDAVDTFCSRLDALRDIQGHQVIDAWQQAARAGQWPQVVEELLLRHYDPVYLKSMARNFTQYAQAVPLSLHSLDAGPLAIAASQLRHECPTHRGPSLEGPQTDD
ncbi:MAG: tRNA 2-selenouridine(34) synthase MnmH [Rubrivivax sp.]